MLAPSLPSSPPLRPKTSERKIGAITHHRSCVTLHATHVNWIFQTDIIIKCHLRFFEDFLKILKHKTTVPHLPYHIALRFAILPESSKTNTKVIKMKTSAVQNKRCFRDCILPG